MTPRVLISVVLVGLVLAGVAATGVRILLNFSHRQLELFCRLRRRRELFGQILDLHEEVALAIEKVEVLGLSLLISGTTLLAAPWWLNAPRSQQFSTVVLAFLVLFSVTSWLPSAIARQWAAPLLLRTWPLWRGLYAIVWPLDWFLSGVHRLFRRLAGQSPQPEKEEEEDALEDEILTMVSAGEREGLLEAEMRDMIEGVFELGDADVSDIMTPRSRVDAIDVRMEWPDILELVVRSGRTRLPVYQGSLDNVIGVLYVKDLLPDLARQAGQPVRPLESLLREPWLCPGTMPLHELLSHFRSCRKHLAVVVDEYQTVLGVVTIEDVLEEIVGEIIDESDPEEELEEGIRVLGGHRFEVEGGVHVDLVNERLGLDLPEADDFDTIAGYVVRRLGYIPQPRESIEHSGARITVLASHARAIVRLLVEVPVGRHKRGRSSDESSAPV